jgi:hypothetical protein
MEATIAAHIHANLRLGYMATAGKYRTKKQIKDSPIKWLRVAITK